MPDNDALKPISTRNRVLPTKPGHDDLKRHPAPQPEQQDEHPPEQDRQDDKDRHGGSGDGHIDEYV